LLVAVYRIFHPENGSSIFLRNVVEIVPDYTESITEMTTSDPAHTEGVRDEGAEGNV
jgi:hypothetical protein